MASTPSSTSTSASCSLSINENHAEMNDSENENDDNDDDNIYDVVIVGGGIVGLSILRHATCLSGWKCALIEKELHLLTWASGSNSGILCTGVDAMPGTLERALIRDSISLIRPYLKSMNIPHRSCGSLVCQWSWDNDDDDDDDAISNNRLDKVLAQSHEAGDVHATKLSPQQLWQKEPNLTSRSLGAVHIPGEVIVDPWLFSIAMAVQAREQGATIFTNFTMDPKLTTWNPIKKTWTVRRRAPVINDSNEHHPLHLRTRAIINATGLWSDQIQEQIHHQQLIQQQQQQNGHDDNGGFLLPPSPCGAVLSPPHWTSRPRRGQYRVFSSNPRTCIQHPIQPIPKQQTKGIFVFSSLYNQIIIGPTALDQESKTNKEVDANVSETLTRHVMQLLPALDKHDYIGDWVGIRPGTDQRDYQIQIVSFSMPWISVAGIRSTGLTASLGIGRHVTHLLSQLLPLCQPKAPSNNNNASSNATCVVRMDEVVTTTPLPPLHELIDCFHRRGDGMVEINGHVYKVTHPITQFGWKSMPPRAAERSQPRHKSKL